MTNGRTRNALEFAVDFLNMHYIFLNNDFNFLLRFDKFFLDLPLPDVMIVANKLNKL